MPRPHSKPPAIGSLAAAISATSMVIAGAVMMPLSPALASDNAYAIPVHSAGTMQDVDDVSLDHLEALSGIDWSAYGSASVNVTASLERNHGRYNLDDRETERLIEGYAKELGSSLERRAELAQEPNAASALQVNVTITQVDLNLPDGLRSSVRTRHYGRWSASLRVEGEVLSPDGSQVLATFRDTLDYEDPFVSRQTSVSVRSDLAMLAQRSASRVAGSLAEMRGV